MISTIVDFYLNGGTNNEGLTFDQMVTASDEQLEKSHTWVQWLFPLNEGSLHNRHAPILTAEDVTALTTDRGHAQYHRAHERFMSFFGMKVGNRPEDGRIAIVPDYFPGYDPDFDYGESQFDKQASNWLTRNNHNLKRITRIIRCAMLLNLSTVAVVTKDAFSDLRRSHPFVNLTEEVLGYWSDAVNLGFDQTLNVSLSRKS